MPLIACPECKGKISDTVDSCIHCGFVLQKPYSIYASCHECEGKIADIEQVCPHCGFPLHKQHTLFTCTDCGKEISRKASKCPYCGAPVKFPLIKQDFLNLIGYWIGSSFIFYFIFGKILGFLQSITESVPYAVLFWCILSRKKLSKEKFIGIIIVSSALCIYTLTVLIIYHLRML